MLWEELEARDKAKAEDKATITTLLSNCAMALLKLAAEHIAMHRPAEAPPRYRDALEQCERALQGAPAGFDVSKVYYRKALALEGLKRFDEALAAMEVGRKAARANGDSEAASKLQKEYKRLERAKRAHEDEQDEQAQQKQREARAGAAREAGRPLAEPSRGQSPPAAATGAEGTAAVSADVVDVTDERAASTSTLAAASASKPPVAASAVASAPPNPFASVQEKDFSFWSERALQARLTGLRHERGGTTIVVEALDTKRSEIHASIKSKRGRGKSLFYDLDLMLIWVGHCALGRRPGEGAGRIKGEFRLYNVGQDTKFEVGGDLHTSYLYSLGFPTQYHNDDEIDLWAQQVKFEAAELFELVSGEVKKWEADLVAKATGQPPKDVLV